MRAAAVVAVLLTGAVPVGGQQTHALVVAGLGGTEEYRAQFTAWALDLRTALVRDHGLPEQDVTVLAERPEIDPSAISARSTKDNVVRELGRIAGEADEGDRLLVVLIGHGTARGDDGRFNLPGPDLSADELAAALGAFSAQSVAIVHTGSSSGAFIAPLSAPGRIVVTATRTVRERNATVFPRYFVEAFTGDGADLNKDGRISVLEAFVYARAEVARQYEEDNELLTEHAVLDDNGDGVGSDTPSAEGEEGRLAALFALGVGGPPRVTDDPVLQGLYAERAAIQGRIEALRATRDSLTQDAYDRALEDLLVELALKTREIRAREGGGS